MAAARAPARATWPQKLAEAQRLGAEGARLEFAKDYTASFEAYVRAGELYLWLWRTYDAHGLADSSGSASRTSDLPGSGADLKGRLQKAAQKVLDRAELIKMVRSEIKPLQRRPLSDEEQQRALVAGGRLVSVQLSEWGDDDGSPSKYAGTTPYESPRQPSLARLHMEQKATYISPRNSERWRTADLFREQMKGSDIVQDIITDCSFVAGLIVAREHDVKWGTSLAHGVLYPQNTQGYPVWSGNGRHDVCLYANGTKRRVTIDDKIPCATGEMPICAIGLASTDTELPCLWPALLEKAYMSLRGSYDFRGSTSSIDLHALTGWIPEHIGFRHSSFQREREWLRLLAAYKKGVILITAGTSKTADSEIGDGEAALISAHNYALLDIYEQEGERYLLLMNPWKRKQLLRPATQHPSSFTDDLRKALPSDQGSVERSADPRDVLRMSWDEACVRLDSLYLNWDPSMFKSRVEFHALWPKETTTAAARSSSTQRVYLLVDVEPSSDSDSAELWLHLARHENFSVGSAIGTEWIAVQAFPLRSNDQDHRLEKRRAETYTDSPHALTRCRAREGPSLVVLSRACDRTTVDGSFTLTASSSAGLRLRELPNDYAHTTQIEGQWTRRSAGGSSMHPSFMHNPQYMVTVPPAAVLSSNDQRITKAPPGLRVAVETVRDTATQILVVWAPPTDATAAQHGHRVDHVAPGDIVCSSGAYTYGLAVAETKSLRPGASYIIIVSTYLPGQEGDFKMTLESQLLPVVEQAVSVPPEGAGMHHRRLRDSWSQSSGTAGGAPRHGHYHENPTFAFEVTRRSFFAFRLTTPLTPLRAIGSIETQQHAKHVRPFVNVTVFERDTGREICSSGPYTDNVCGAAVRSADFERGNYTAVVSTFEQGTEADFVLDVYGERPFVCTKLVN